MNRVTQGGNGVTKGWNPLTHRGEDIGFHSKPESDNNILAHSDGVVVSIVSNYNKTDKFGNSYGNYIKIQHNNGYYTLYAHLKYGSLKVKKGSKVKKGQVIAVMGETGHCRGRHLHFEVRNTWDIRIDPTPYLNTDLPNNSSAITYQVYDNVKKKWWANIKVGGTGTNPNDYAGYIGHSIGGLYIDKLTYRVHDKKKKQWLPYVTGRKDYAGNLGNAIDGVQIKNATYRVHIKNGGWLSWISKVDNTSMGYAGIYGKEIDAIQIK